MLVLAAAGCASEPKNPGKFPAREAGCDVQVFPETPNYATENIGSVKASCEPSVTDADCLRELRDQACKLGADTVWGVSEPLVVTGGRKRASGRAAHRK
jgi:hypothetical protein